MTGETLTIDYTAQVWREGRQYVAHAMPLDVMSAGSTPEEARHALSEAVKVFLETANDIGTLDEVLSESGYEFHEGAWRGPHWVGIEQDSLSLAV